jgi:hypothetical protein
MAKWEYCMVIWMNDEVVFYPPDGVIRTVAKKAGRIDAINYLNKLGSIGWEAVGFSLGPNLVTAWTLKRPLA